MRILLIKFRNLGDVLLSSCLVKNLKLNYPKSKIDFAVNKNCVDILRNNPNINKVIPYDRKKAKERNFYLRIIDDIKFIMLIRKKEYDLVVNLTEGERGALISLFSNARIKIGFKLKSKFLSLINPYDINVRFVENKHTVFQDLQFLDSLNLKVYEKSIEIFHSNLDEKYVNEVLIKNKIQNFVHIHPVSRWMFKAWNDSNMSEVIDYLILEKNYSVIVTGSNSTRETNRIKQILKNCKSKPINLSGELSINQLAALSKKATLFFGIDTAPMHIAAAVNTPVFALFGASFPAYWGPWSNTGHNNYYNKCGLQINLPHAIISNMNHKIFYENGIKKTIGMSEITVSEVKEYLDNML